MTPTDPLAFVGDPPLWRPVADEVHVSVAFTWDRDEGERLAAAWGHHYPMVRLGGPAFGDHPNGFTPGRYIKPGVTFTTRGCNRRCPWCLVPDLEGKLVEIPHFAPGYIIQDNNLLQASREHLTRVFAMLKTQRAAVFSGGLDARLLDDWVADQLRGLTIKQLFLAADTDSQLAPLERAIKRLSFLPRYKIRVYTMIAYGGETIEEAVERMEAVYQLGGVPFAQLYQPPDRYIKYSKPWRDLARTWSRPAAIAALHSPGGMSPAR